MFNSSNKIVGLILAVGMVFSMVGCGKDTAKVASSTSSEAVVSSSSDSNASIPAPANAYAVTKPVELTFATQDVGTTAYVYASTMANMFTDAFPKDSIVDVTTTSPGGVGAPIVLENGECNIIISNAAPAKWAYESGILGKPATQNVRSIAGGLDKAFINILLTQSFVDKTGITTIEEIVEKKYPINIAIKSAGAFGELSCSKVLEVLGVTYDDVKSWGGTITQTGTDGIISLLKDGKADMTIDHLAAGQSATTELCMTSKMFFPQLSDDTLSKLVAVGYDETLIDPNTWTGQDKAIKSVGSAQVVLAAASMDDATAYTLAKTICEGKATLVTASAAMEAFDPTTAWEPLKAGAPLHPGAEAYYKEMGYIK